MASHTVAWGWEFELPEAVLMQEWSEPDGQVWGPWLGEKGMEKADHLSFPSPLPHLAWGGCFFSTSCWGFSYFIVLDT